MVDILISGVIDVDYKTNEKHWNKLAITCLLQLPLEVLSKKQREHVLGGWVPGINGSLPTDSEGDIYASILSLKLNTMRRPTAYKVTLHNLTTVVVY